MEQQEVTIPEIITVRDLAELLGETPITVIKTLMSSGVLASNRTAATNVQNQAIGCTGSR